MSKTAPDVAKLRQAIADERAAASGAHPVDEAPWSSSPFFRLARRPVGPRTSSRAWLGVECDELEQLLDSIDFLAGCVAFYSEATGKIEEILDSSPLRPPAKAALPEQVRFVVDRLAFYFAQTYNHDEADYLRREQLELGAHTGTLSSRVPEPETDELDKELPHAPRL